MKNICVNGFVHVNKTICRLSLKSCDICEKLVLNEIGKELFPVLLFLERKIAEQYKVTWVAKSKKRVPIENIGKCIRELGFHSLIHHGCVGTEYDLEYSYFLVEPSAEQMARLSKIKMGQLYDTNAKDC